MGLARENELDGALGVLNQAEESFLLTEKQSTTFVSRKSGGKPDRQDVRVKNAVDLAQLLGRFTEQDTLATQSVANKIDQTSFQQMMRFPQHFVGDIHHSAPVIRVGEMFLPIGAEIFCVNAMKLRSGPCFGVDPIGNAVD